MKIKKREIKEKTKTIDRKEGVGACGKERKREKNKKKRISDKKRERKESENYKTENGRKLVMKERGKRKRELDKGEKSCGVKIYIFVTNKSLISRPVLFNQM